MSTSGLANDDVPHLNVLANYSLRRPKYSKVLSHLREVVTTTVMIEKMKRPEKVSIVENDEGDMLLVYFSHLDVVDTKHIISDQLARQGDMLESGVDDFRKENAEPKEEMKTLQCQNQELREENTLVREQDEKWDKLLE
ncbi:MAG: Karyopherin transporter [Alectoria fallacina]|uniref:Karyopherin transporter n=1 Tax=Alectoria fallacina TaxID=1903189 RepID=A0A8H3ISZ0_9LECA|nr:MAG: Karyopherin transporter [Alectoria fallacina]